MHSLAADKQLLLKPADMEMRTVLLHSTNDHHPEEENVEMEGAFWPSVPPKVNPKRFLPLLVSTFLDFFPHNVDNEHGLTNSTSNASLRMEMAQDNVPNKKEVCKIAITHHDCTVGGMHGAVQNSTMDTMLITMANVYTQCHP